MAHQFCENCRFFCMRTNECRQHSPRPVAMNPYDPAPEAKWPRVENDDWCGEFQEKAG
jgi:hypothetical protein